MNGGEYAILVGVTLVAFDLGYQSAPKVEVESVHDTIERRRVHKAGVVGLWFTMFGLLHIVIGWWG